MQFRDGKLSKIALCDFWLFQYTGSGTVRIRAADPDGSHIWKPGCLPEILFAQGRRNTGKTVWLEIR